MNKKYYEILTEILLHSKIIKRVLNFEQIKKLLTLPPKEDMGDISFPCFKIAKAIKEPVNNIASEIKKELSEIINENEDFIKIKEIGAHINFFLNKSKFINNITNQMLYLIKIKEEETTTKANINKTNKLKNQKEKIEEKKLDSNNTKSENAIIIEFSSPNIAKPLSIAHLRSTSIGNSLSNIFKYLGHKIIKINHIGDWGTSFGKLIYAYKTWGKEYNFQENKIKSLLNLYILFHKKLKEDPKLENKAKECFKKLEQGEKEYIKTWEYFKQISLDEFNKIYKLLNISFDYYTGESFYQQDINKLLTELKEKNISKLSQKATIIDFEENLNKNKDIKTKEENNAKKLPPLLIKKSDETTIYATRDLAAAIYRQKKFNFKQMYYIVGSEQKLHFKQIFQTLKLMKKSWVKNCHHVPFGLISLKEQKLSSREGRVIFLEEVINKLKELCLKRLEENSQKENREKTKKQDSKEIQKEKENREKKALNLAISAILFADLKSNRLTNINFDWNEMLNPKGETGIYIQYTHARLNSIINNYIKHFGKENYNQAISNKTESKEENSFQIIKELSNFQEKIIEAKTMLEPSIIANYIVNLAKLFSAYYQKYQIINKNNKILSMQRIKTVLIVKTVISQGLKLLGIKPIEKI